MAEGSFTYRKLVLFVLFAVGALGSAVGFAVTRGREPEDYALLALVLWFSYLMARIQKGELDRVALLAVRTVGAFLLYTIYLALVHLREEGLWPSLLWTAVIYPGVYVALPPSQAQRFLKRYFALLVLVSTAAYLLATARHGFSFGHLNVHLQWLLSQTALLILSTLIYEMGMRAARAEREARTDPLTGLANRRRFFEAVAEALEKERVAVLLLDLDGLKAVNDRYGHPAGDRLLSRVAHCLRRATRAGDLPARLGGDEFAVLIPGGNAETARRIAERIRREVSGERVLNAPVSVSVGFAVAKEGEDADALIARADRALYQAKRSGGDAVIAAP